MLLGPRPCGSESRFRTKGILTGFDVTSQWIR